MITFLSLPIELQFQILSLVDTPNAARLVCRQCSKLIPAKKHSDVGYFANVNIFQWYIKENKLKLDEILVAWCAELGKLELVRWLRDNDCPWDETTCSFAAVNGHLEVLQYFKMAAFSCKTICNVAPRATIGSSPLQYF